MTLATVAASAVQPHCFSIEMFVKTVFQVASMETRPRTVTRRSTALSTLPLTAAQPAAFPENSALVN